MISANCIDIREVDGLLQQGKNAKRNHYVVMKIDGREVFKSAKAHCVPTPQWKEDKTIRFDTTSDVNFVLYRSRLLERLSPVRVAECRARGIDFLDTGVEQVLVDMLGTSTLSIKFNLVAEPHEEFMKAIKQEVSQLVEVKGADAAQRVTTVGAGISTALKAMVPVIDSFASTHPILNGAWIALSSAYKITQNQANQDAGVLDLVESVIEMAGTAHSWKEPQEIPGTTSVIEEIGRALLEVAMLVHDYVDPAIHGKAKFLARTLTHSLSDMPSRIAKNRTLLKGLTEKLKLRVALDTNARMKSLQHGLDKTKIQEWIYTLDSDTSLSYNAAQKVHLPGTGSWFLDGPQFSEWKAQPGSVLWLYGGPGSGKTVLSYSAINNIINFCKLKPSVRGYAYFFFDARNDKLRDFAHEKFTRSLITQLSDRCSDDIPAALVSMYRACDNGHRQPPLISLEESLLKVLDCFEDVYIVIDSLDECADNSKSDLLNWIKSVMSKASGRLHLMAASRPEQKIKQGLESLSCSSLQQVSVSDLSTKSDISALFDAELAKMAKWKLLEIPKIKTAILPRSDGSFRWVALQLHDVSQCSSKNELYAQLDSLPKDLDETYARIFKRSKNPGVLQNMVQWLAFSRREMTVKEIAEVAAVDLSRVEGPVYDPEMRYEEPAEILNFCYGLVTEVEGIIKLAHFSVKEFLVKYIQPRPNRTSAQLSHSVIAQTCLAQLLYLDQPSIAPWSEDIDDFRNHICSSFPLSDYAATYWVSHFHSASADATDGPRLLALLRGLIAIPQSYAMTSWVLLHDPDWRGHQGELAFDDTASPLYYACFAGLTELVGHLIAEGADINEVRLGSVPLVGAIRKGHLGIAKLLLEQGVDAEAAGAKALRLVSESGHLEAVRLLLEQGVDVKVAGAEALRLASGSGHFEVVKLLLEHGADVKVAGAKALEAASGNGHLEVVKLLLEHGTAVNVQDGEDPALNAASLHGHLEVIKLLLAHDADTNIRDKERDTSLQLASYWGYLDIVKLLLEHGADVSAEAGMAERGVNGTALELASKWGHSEVIKLLQGHGADPKVAGTKALDID